MNTNTNDPTPTDPADTDEYAIDLGDAAALTLGEGSARNENKRSPYN